MSQDPFGYSPNLPPEPPAGLDLAPIRDRVRTPAIFLIAVGVLNLVFAFGELGFGVLARSMPEEKLEEMMAQQNPEQLAELEARGYTIRDILNYYIYSGLVGGAVALLASLLALFGGARMLALKSYGLAVFASVVTAVPCISPSACCLLGILSGLWSLVVLLNADVRAAFR